MHLYMREGGIEGRQNFNCHRIFTLKEEGMKMKL